MISRLRGLRLALTMQLPTGKTMDYWGVKSYENDGAADALDAGFDRAHGTLYEELMDDRNPMTFEQVQQKLANLQTLEASIDALGGSLDPGSTPETWDDWGRLALVGIIVRHAELGVSIPEAWRQHAIDWLEHEEIEWDEATIRRLRVDKEIGLLRRQGNSA
jgi:hypothetical protein